MATGEAMAEALANAEADRSCAESHVPILQQIYEGDVSAVHLRPYSP